MGHAAEHSPTVDIDFEPQKAFGSYTTVPLRDYKLPPKHRISLELSEELGLERARQEQIRKPETL